MYETIGTVSADPFDSVNCFIAAAGECLSESNVSKEIWGYSCAVTSRDAKSLRDLLHKRH